ncbi:MAG TPA: peptide deformylase [Methanocorpusculum sp.]|nr:peptide deformylase [Methanocorpusculum sp.]
MEIQIYGSDVLAEKAATVPEITPELMKILDEMVPLMVASHGVGLAAPQVGISQRFFVMNAGDKVRKIINPEIVQYGSALAEMEEGCLSIPGIHKKVRRPRRIIVKYTDETGATVEEKLKDFTARVFQHEYDHLDGIMFVDRLTPMSRKLIQRQLDALKEKQSA